MAAFIFAFAAILVVCGAEEEFVEVKVRPSSKYYDSRGFFGSSLQNNVLHRSVRRPSTCKFPTKMTDSQLDCKLYPSKVVCSQTCMYGYTLKDSIQREMRCNYSENVWTPTPQFENCKPFIDCTVSLGPGGKYKCHTNFMDKGPICEISCAHYEDKPAVPTSTYQCNIDGMWKPKLPFCAKPGSGIKLVPPPNGPKLVTF